MSIPSVGGVMNLRKSAFLRRGFSTNESITTCQVIESQFLLTLANIHSLCWRRAGATFVFFFVLSGAFIFFGAGGVVWIFSQGIVEEGQAGAASPY